MYSLQANSIKYMFYFHKDKIRIFQLSFGRDSLAFEIRWEYLSSRHNYPMLTALYKMNNTLCPLYLDNCLPPTA